VAHACHGLIDRQLQPPHDLVHLGECLIDIASAHLPVGVTMAAKPKRPKFMVAQYDSADYLKSEADIKNYLAAVFEEPMDREMLIHTLGVVARARGMMKLAKETGITRAGLYKALSPKGNPSFETVAKIVGAFGMRLSAQAT
jgi:probable addiction module antidote protein